MSATREAQLQENARLRNELAKQSTDGPSKELAMENIKLKRKLGESVSAEEIMQAKGVKVTTAREWHEGSKSE